MGRDERLITRARTERGIIAWAYQVASTPGYGCQALGEVRGGGHSPLDAHAEAAWVLRQVDALAGMERLVVIANYAADKPARVRLCFCLEDMFPDADAGLVHQLVADWCGGGKSSERELCRRTGLPERSVARLAGRITGALMSWDWLAMRTIGQAFRDRGWVGDYHVDKCDASDYSLT